MSKKVRDIVHNYIYLTPLEEMITENPLFLRLHYIHQNSFAYLTYPSAHNTRFSHSLGVMHVAGDIFRSAYIRTKSDQLDIFLTNVREEIERLQVVTSDAGCAVPVTLEKVVAEMTDAGSSAFFDNPLYASLLRMNSSADRTRDKENRSLAIIVLQSIRIAAMLHDVGHPPFSHIVEYALLEGLIQRRSTFSEKNGSDFEYKGHEYASHKIAAEILSGIEFQNHRFISRTPHFAAICASLAQALFSKDSLMTGLGRTLLSGDLDADRLDYVLRDAKSAGLNVGYDLERLLDSSLLKAATEDSAFEIGYRLGALPTIENFFGARYDLYRWMIYHHDTTRRNLVVQRFIILMLSSTDLDTEILRVSSKFCQMACGGDDGSYRNYRSFLDSVLINLMWDVYELISTKKVPTPTESEMLFYLNVILCRSNFLLPSICKSPGEYAYLAEKASSEFYSKGAPTDVERQRGATAASVENLNAMIRLRFEDLTNELEKQLPNRTGNTRKEAEGIAKYRLAKEIEETLKNHVDKARGLNNYKIYVYYIGSFSASLKKSLRLRSSAGGGTPIEVSELSPTIKMLSTAWAMSPQLMVYVQISNETASKWAVEESAVRENVFSRLRDVIGSALGSYLVDNSRMVAVSRLPKKPSAAKRARSPSPPR